LIFFSIASLILPLFSTACGPSESEIRDAVRDGIRNAYQERTQDLGYKLGRWLFGSTQVSTTTRYFRAVEGSSIVEQRGFDAQGDQEVRVVESTSLRNRTERIVGRELVKAPPTNDLDIKYNWWKYYAEVTEANLWMTTVTTTKIGVNQDIDKTEQYFTVIRGVLAYWLGTSNDLREVYTGGIVGMFDPSLNTLYGTPANNIILLGKKDPQPGEIFQVPSTPLGGTLFRVVGQETYNLTLNGESRAVQATKIEVKSFVNPAPDPAQAYIQNCLPWTHVEMESTGVTNTTINTLDCPAQIFSGTVYWFENIPVRFEGTVTSVALEPINNARTAFQSGNSYRRNDPGVGFELIESCDPVSGDADNTTVTCRYFSTVDDGTVCIDNTPGCVNRASVDFRQRRSLLKRYAHLRVNQSQVLWQATEIRDEPLQ
jgi:hypothetical protein